jgi:crotonobetainyl-CoA:carnitine CoA-transferase CaiB-like acyl-CoA transferase
VLEVAHALSGPFCAQVLADLGADVVKVEPPEGDFFRKLGPFLEGDAERQFGGLFQTCNRNKRSIAINLKTQGGRDLFGSLAARADILIENYRAGVLDRLGLGYKQLSVLNPRLVYASIRGFGDECGGESPYRDWPAFDVIAQAMGGWMGITGFAETGPTKSGAGLADTVPALFGALGVVSALWAAKRDGVGQYVDIAMVDCVLATAENLSAIYAYKGASLTPSGNANTGLMPTGSFAARDGDIVLSAPHDHHWEALCALIERPDLLADPRLKDEEGRWAHRDYLAAEIETFTRAKTKAELKQLFGGKIPFGPVNTAADIFHEPHFAKRDMLVEVDQPGTGKTVKIANTPIKLSRTPGGVRSRAPCLGEHTESVLAELGLDANAVAALRKSGALPEFADDNVGAGRRT